ncbi:hypothetical protein [Zobellia roscoffensis]|uniref:hypothetical protein n=1 Tax=Zobellia roscoffensis TaxID=2779508 RepID=UPI00188B0A7E|nr:hypothetical protein [Zobellia roscoffensis]
MKMRNFILISFLSLTFIHTYGQTERDSLSTIQKTEKLVEKQTKIQQLKVPIYKLFPTDNYWTFIKLDTRNGKMWQVHFSISKEGYKGELILNSSSLVWTDEEINGRFTLYPTENIYNYILLDQINGKTYQVQWNNEKEKRFVSPIY